MTLRRVWIGSPNHSSRGGAVPRLLVLHSAEGALTYQALGNFFANPSSGVSSHVGIDDTPNTVGEYVRRDQKAWTAAGANPVAVQAELCAFAAWSAAEWDQHPNMLANCAAWLAEESAALGIPLVRLSAAQAQGSGRGVCQHADLGSWGGNHSDCGPGFPIDHVIAMAAGTAGSSAPEDPLHITTKPGTARLDLVACLQNGNVWHYWTDDNGNWATLRSENLGGKARAASATWLSPTRLQVVVEGADNRQVYRRHHDGRAWDADWVSIGVGPLYAG